MKEDIYILKTGRYKGYRLFYTTAGQIFPHDGWVLEKDDKNGNIIDIQYLETLLNKI